MSNKSNSYLINLYNLYLPTILILFSFFLNYISSLYSELDLFKIDLTKKWKDKKKKSMLFFILKNGNLLFAIIYFTQNIINWSISISFMGRLEKDFKENKAITFLVTFIIGFFTEILSRWLATTLDISKKIIKSDLFMVIIYSIIRPFSFLRILIKPRKKIFINSEKDVIRFINNLTEENVLEKREAKLVQSAFNFDELKLNSIFISWKNVVFLQEKISYNELKEIHKENFLTRYPVLNDKEEMVGIFNTKVFNWKKIIDENISWQDCIDKKIVVVSPKDLLSRSFEKIRTSNCKMAIVKQRKKILGIVTLQDILVALVGKMNDEKERMLSIN